MEDRSKEGGDDAVQGQKPATRALRRAKSPSNRNSEPKQGNLSSRATTVPTNMEDNSSKECRNGLLGPKCSIGAIPKERSLLSEKSTMQRLPEEDQKNRKPPTPDPSKTSVAVKIPNLGNEKNNPTLYPLNPEQHSPKASTSFSGSKRKLPAPQVSFQSQEPLGFNTKKHKEMNVREKLADFLSSLTLEDESDEDSS